MFVSIWKVAVLISTSIVPATSLKISLQISSAQRTAEEPGWVIDHHPSWISTKKYGRIGLARNLRHFWFIFLFLKLGNLQSLRRCVWRWIAEYLNIHMCCRLFSDILSSDLPWTRNCLWTKQNKTVDFNYFCKHENGRMSESSRCSNSFVTANCHE